MKRLILGFTLGACFGFSVAAASDGFFSTTPRERETRERLYEESTRNAEHQDILRDRLRREPC